MQNAASTPHPAPVAHLRGSLAAAANSAEAELLDRRVEGWLETLHVPEEGPWAYRLHRRAAPTIYSSCFAVFLKHLFGRLDSLGVAERDAWIGYIARHQDPATGLFRDASVGSRVVDPGHDETHMSLQLTTFALSALSALGGSPLYGLRYLEDKTDPPYVRRYLSSLNWARPSNSGNKAMFLGILLAYARDREGNGRAADALDAWFAWHDAHQRPRSGFWGTTMDADYHQGMQGAYHQLLLYDYDERPVLRADRIIDSVLRLQQSDGLYAPQLGGGSCPDMDAVDILVKLTRRTGHRASDVRRSLRRTLDSVLALQNPDGGFPWAEPRSFRLTDYSRTLTGLVRHRQPYLWYWEARRGIRDQRAAAQRLPVATGWSDVHRQRWQSSVFDTWFRCLTIAEAALTLGDVAHADLPWRFLDVPGLGWHRAVGGGAS